MLKYMYDVVWYRVVDGDSLHLKVQSEVEHEFDFGFHVMQTIKKTYTYQDLFRLQGINTPEIRGEERPEGLKAKEHLIKLLDPVAVPQQEQEVAPGVFKAITYKQGKYGRYLTTLYRESTQGGEKLVTNINAALIVAGYATPYKTADAIQDPLKTGPVFQGSMQEVLIRAEQLAQLH